MSVYHSLPPSPHKKTIDINNQQGEPGPRAMEGREYGPYGHLNRRVGGGQTMASMTTASTMSNFGAEEQRSASSNSTSAEKLVKPQNKMYHSTVVDVREQELDDDLHDPKGADRHSRRISWRGFLNVLTLMILMLGLLMLFAGYPILHELYKIRDSNRGAFNVGGTNGTGQVPRLSALRTLVDPDTPASARTWTSSIHDKTLELQFSDEFEVEGRTFWPGDDQFVGL